MKKTQTQVALAKPKSLPFGQFKLEVKKLKQVKSTLETAVISNGPVAPQAVIRHQRDLMVFIALGFSGYIFVLDFLIRLSTRSGVLINASTLNHKNWYIQPSFRYRFADGLTFIVQSDLLFGKPDGFLGQFVNNDRLQVKFVYDF